MGESEEKFGQLKGIELDKDGLAHIWNFGWLRSQELARLLWPNNKFGIKYAERQIRKWSENGFVICRKLPKHNGTALVIAEKGVRFLAEHSNIIAKSGKDWGDTIDSKWIAPIFWHHDLLSNGLLTILFEKGYGVIPEKQIKRENPDLTKIPDGLAIKKKQVIWIEVESHRKTGESMDNMVKSILRNINNDAPVVSNLTTNRTVVAYAKNSKDERNHFINHKLRVVQGIKRHSAKDVDIDFFEMKLRGSGPISFEYFPEAIESDRVLVEMKKAFWEKQPNESLHAYIDGSLINVKKNSEHYSWQVADQLFSQNRSEPQWKITAHGQSKTQLGARKSAVKFIIGSEAEL